MRRLVMLAVAVIVLVGATAAYGQNPASRVYDGSAGAVQRELSRPAPSRGGLPFTGLDVALLMGGGGALVLVGGGLWRLTREKT
jgi:hypothetical protein